MVRTASGCPGATLSLTQAPQRDFALPGLRHRLVRGNLLVFTGCQALDQAQARPVGRPRRPSVCMEEARPVRKTAPFRLCRHFGADVGSVPHPRKLLLYAHLALCNRSSMSASLSWSESRRAEADMRPLKLSPTTGWPRISAASGWAQGQDLLKSKAMLNRKPSATRVDPCETAFASLGATLERRRDRRVGDRPLTSMGGLVCATTQAGSSSPVSPKRGRFGRRWRPRQGETSRRRSTHLMQTRCPRG